MRKVSIVLMIAAALSAQSLFAFGDKMGPKPCAPIAKACLDAKFSRGEAATKNFWRDCMRPIMLDQKVEGVSVDAATVKTCRTHKIEELKRELAELEKVSSK